MSRLAIDRFRFGLQWCLAKAVDMGLDIAITPHLDDGLERGELSIYPVCHQHMSCRCRADFAELPQERLLYSTVCQPLASDLLHDRIGLAALPMSLLCCVLKPPAGGWRNALVFDPLAKYGGFSYYEIMLRPIAQALNAVITPNTQVRLHAVDVRSFT